MILKRKRGDAERSIETIWLNARSGDAENAKDAHLVTNYAVLIACSFSIFRGASSLRNGHSLALAPSFSWRVPAFLGAPESRRY